MQIEKLAVIHGPRNCRSAKWLQGTLARILIMGERQRNDEDQPRPVWAQGCSEVGKELQYVGVGWAPNQINGVNLEKTPGGAEVVEGRRIAGESIMAMHHELEPWDAETIKQALWWRATIPKASRPQTECRRAYKNARDRRKWIQYAKLGSLTAKLIWD